MPLLAARTRPRTGDAAFGVEAVGRPALPVVFALGTGQGNAPLGHGCSLLVQQVLATALVAADARGFAQRDVPLPAVSTLRGLVLTAQACSIRPPPAGSRSARACA